MTGPGEFSPGPYKKEHKMKKKDSVKNILIAPALLFFFCLTLFPLVFNIVMSLCNWKLGGNIKFVGLNNYIYAFTNETFWRTILNTIIVTVVSVLIEYVLALVLAYNINKLLHGKKAFRILMLIPMLMAPVVIGFMWKQMFNELYGPLNDILSVIGLGNIPWISKSGVSLISIVLVYVWEGTPFIIIILLAGLQSMPKEPIESARVDGASEKQIFFDIIFKMLMPASMVAITLRSIETFKIFDTIYIITAGGPGVSSMSASMYAYQVGLRNFNVGKAAALCVIMLIIVLGVSQVIMKVQEKRKAALIAKLDALAMEEDFSVYEEDAV